MTLYDVLRVTKYDEVLHCYWTNSFDQNVPIGFGARAELLDEEINDDLFWYLMCEVDMLTIAKDGSFVVRVVDAHSNERYEAQFSEDQTKKWDPLNPGSRPYKFSCEMEDFRLDHPRREEYQELQEILVRLAELSKTYMDKAASALKEMDGLVQDLDARCRQMYEELQARHEKLLEQQKPPEDSK